MARSDLLATGPEGASSQRSKQRRAPAPMLSPQHLASARSLPHSIASTPTPSLLTPPVIGTPNMSPPPRHEADDYMNVHAHDHHHRKRKHPRKIARKLHNTREESEGSRPQQRTLRSGPQTASSNGSGCETCAVGISDGDEDSNSNSPLIKDLGRPNLHVQTRTTLSPSAIVVDDPGSPAVNSLRSLSFQVLKRSNSQGLQRVSTVLANTLSLFKPKPIVSFAAVPSHNSSKKAEEASRRSSAHSKSLAFPDPNLRRQTLDDGKDTSRALGTPATITLRKASNVYATSPTATSMSASLTRENEHKRVAGAPASELLAFYSSPTLEKRPTLILSSPESIEAPRSLKEQSTFKSKTESQPLRRRSKSIAQFSDISNARRCSTPADAALTFSDVHVAPGSFTVGVKSRKQSLIPTEFSRRISTVQFWSRDSIHEVIWREDETLSESSLTSSSKASQHVGHSLRSTPSPESKTQELATKPKRIQDGLPMVFDSPSVFTKLPENLFRWSWGASSTYTEDTPRADDPKSGLLGQVVETTSQTAALESEPFGRILVTSTSDPGFASLETSSDQHASRCHKPSFSELPSVQSFPPLRARSSTAEWQKTPLVDLNDPLAGRVTQYRGQEGAYSVGLGRGVGSSMVGSKKRRSSQLHGTAGDRDLNSRPNTNARLGSLGRIGSGIGASSRKRVMSMRKF